MTKAEKRAAAIAALDASLKGDDPEPPKEAIITLVGDLLDSFDRIATALEKHTTIAPMGEGRIVGEVAKFGPAFDPKAVERIATALEKIASGPDFKPRF